MTILQRLGAGASKSRRKGRLPILASALAAGGLLASTLMGVSGATAATRHAAAPILLGLDTTLSGPTAAQAAGDAQFFEAWIDYTNATGGIDGHQIKLFTLDDKGDDGQALLNFETLWSTDHVSLIAKVSEADAPYPLIKKENIPVVTYTGDPRIYSSYYSSITTDGDNIGEVGAEVAYWFTKIQKVHPKVVAVQLLNVYSSWDSFLVNGWKKDGAKTVYLVPDGGPTANCSPLIVKFKAEGVQYIDMEGLQGTQCILAEQTLGWKPVDGQGGALTSQIGEAELIGKPYVGVVAGSPNSLYNGAPIFKTPSTIDKTFVANIKKYAPSLYNYSYLDGTGTIIGYANGMLATYMLKGALDKYGKITTANLLNFIHGVKNYQNDLQPPVGSFAPNCKTGSDGTIWGFWHLNAKPTPLLPKIYMTPTSGPNWITGAHDLGLSPCVLTTQANAAFPHG
jgi:hypothetical protein